MFSVLNIYENDGVVQYIFGGAKEFQEAWMALCSNIDKGTNLPAFVTEFQEFYIKYNKFRILYFDNRADYGFEDPKICLDMDAFVSFLFYLAFTQSKFKSSKKFILNPYITHIFQFQVAKQLTPGVTDYVYAEELGRISPNYRRVSQRAFDIVYGILKNSDIFRSAVVNMRRSSCGDGNFLFTGRGSSKCIGRGRYGCVYYPAFVCHDIDSSKHVAKVMILINAIKEQFKMEKIRALDPEGMYHLKLIARCNVPRDFSLKGCKVDKLSADNATALIYPFGGGEFSRITRGRVKMDIEVLLAFKNVFDALVMFERNNFVHCDVKPANILFTREPVVLKLNDFGSSFTYSNTRIWPRGRKVYSTYPMYVFVLIAIVDKYILTDTFNQWKERVSVFSKKWCALMEEYAGFSVNYEEVFDRLLNTRNIPVHKHLKFAKIILSRIDLFGVGVCLHLAYTHLEGSTIIGIQEEYDTFVMKLLACQLSPMEARVQYNDLVRLALLRGPDRTGGTGGKPWNPVRVSLSSGFKVRRIRFTGDVVKF